MVQVEENCNTILQSNAIQKIKYQITFSTPLKSVFLACKRLLRNKCMHLHFYVRNLYCIFPIKNLSLLSRLDYNNVYVNVDTPSENYRSCSIRSRCVLSQEICKYLSYILTSGVVGTREKLLFGVSTVGNRRLCRVVCFKSKLKCVFYADNFAIACYKNKSKITT